MVLIPNPAADPSLDTSDVILATVVTLLCSCRNNIVWSTEFCGEVSILTTVTLGKTDVDPDVLSSNRGKVEVSKNIVVFAVSRDAKVALWLKTELFTAPTLSALLPTDGELFTTAEKADWSEH